MEKLTLQAFVLVLMALNQTVGSPVSMDQNESEGTLPEDWVKRFGHCPIGWSQYKSRCFLYVPKARTWAQAERNCLSMGANLASIHNIQEYHFVQNLIRDKTHQHNEAWIGGSDAQQSGVWLWSDGSYFYYTNWCKGEPTNGQHCLQINYSYNKCWDNLQCDQWRPFVCARKV